MQTDFIGLVDNIDDTLIVALISHEVEPIGVNQQDAHVILLLTKEVEITLLDVFQISVTYLLLVATPALANVALEACHIGIEVHQQFRLGHVGENDVEKRENNWYSSSWRLLREKINDLAT